MLIKAFTAILSAIGFGMWQSSIDASVFMVNLLMLIIFITDK